MKRLLLSLAVLSLAACADTTGLSEESSRPPAGNPDALVTVVEYADLQCPACQAAYTAVTKPLLESYGDRIRYEYRHFPLQSIHQYAMEAAEGAECAADQGKFWEFVDLAFVNQKQLSSAAIGEWGQELGLDAALFERCRQSRVKRDTIRDDYAQGEEEGVNGTPTFFVNGQRVESTLAAIVQAIDKELGGTGQRL